MALRTVLIKFCDYCWAETGEQIPVEYTFTIGLGEGIATPNPRVAEVCAKHAEPFREMLTQLSVLQTLAQAMKQPGPIAPAPAKTPKKILKTRMLTCELCGKEISAAAAATHTWTMHVGVPMPPQPKECPDCGFTSDAGVGMSQHRRTKHGYDSIGEALSKVGQLVTA